MNIEQIEKFLVKQKSHKGEQVKISFKKRSTMYGLFVEAKDYKDLKAKNFWRIVPQLNMDAWNASQDSNLAKIFDGSGFSRLGVNDI
jgi:hypothetical protein